MVSRYACPVVVVAGNKREIVGVARTCENVRERDLLLVKALSLGVLQEQSSRSNRSSVSCHDLIYLGSSLLVVIVRLLL